MHVRVLVGPAGSGKTTRCLAEVRAALQAAPEGDPLLFLAPKQATFQLERQLLADPALPGYTRLRIVSFDRLAQDVVEAYQAPPRWLSDEGRVMVLRALLARHQAALRVFRTTAKLPGFARQLSLTLRDLQRHQCSGDQLRRTADRCAPGQTLGDKLRDCAWILGAYRDWLDQHRLEDGDVLLDLATRLLRQPAAHPAPAVAGAPPFRVQSLWLDGFAEMTPQELELLSALLPRCQSATLAFCLPARAAAGQPGFSPWSLIGRTCAAVQSRVSALPGVTVEVVAIAAERVARFARCPALAHLEQFWDLPDRSDPSDPTDLTDPPAIRLLQCLGPEQEAVAAAHEVLRWVRAGGRFREVAVLVRSLETYHAVLARVFRRYEIPFFLDRRQPVGHHPLAELTRYLLRTSAFRWRHEDWFGALKTGLMPASPEEVDQLENDALEHGWEGDVWHRPVVAGEDGGRASATERLRSRVMEPCQAFERALGDAARAGEPTGLELARALRACWGSLGVPERLEQWAEEAPAGLAAVHRTVWDQMLDWLDNLSLAFEGEAMPLRDWLPIVEAGLGTLSVGVIPPALDQVLVGAIDRSRNPELRLAVVLGVNAGVFPAVPAMPGVISEDERRALDGLGLTLGPDRRLQLAHERYYGYIACTRASERLVLTFAETDAQGEPLSPSPFIHQVRRLFPALAVERFAGPALAEPSAAEHPCELDAATLQHLRDPERFLPGWTAVLDAAGLAEHRRRLERVAAYARPDRLSPDIARALYGPALRTSVSALEQFAACPFRFLVHAGLRAEARRQFEADARERGSFQHEVLARFHQELVGEGRRWRDLTPAEAVDRVRRLAAAVADEYREGLFRSAPENRFAARSLGHALAEYAEVAVGWMSRYGFDPALVELEFGGPESPLPPWTLDLGEGNRLEFRGRIDRIDVAPGGTPEERRCVVIDYKSSARAVDPLLLEHGIQLQLPAYLAALRRIPEAAELLRAGRLEPAGVFYVPLRGQYDSANTRGDALEDPATDRESAYQHHGRFRADLLPALDRGYPKEPGRQFAYRVTANGALHGASKEPMAPEAFEALLDRVEEQLRHAGRRILAGEAAVDPYRKGTDLACNRCDYAGICRVDPWTHRFRTLQSAAAAQESDD